MSDRTFQPSDLSSFSQMYQLANGFKVTQAIYVAARLGIADLVGPAPQRTEDLASATKTDGPSLRRLLQFLASLGILAEDNAGNCGHTPLSETLRRDHPHSIRGLVIMCGSEFMWRPWGQLCEAIATGQPAFDRIYGASLFDYLGTHPADGEIFDAAMSATSPIVSGIVVAAYDFSGFQCIVDVGGGQGALLHGILLANPKLRGVLTDRPAVVAGVKALRAEPIADRCDVVGGDFFESVPSGADGYILSFVVHDWNDGEAAKILRNCRRAIRPDGKLLLIERVLKPANQFDDGKLADLNMLVMLGGRERNEADFRALLHEAGFATTRIIPTAGPMSIIESQPA
jgi:SAM-dependent methyltransferase